MALVGVGPSIDLANSDVTGSWLDLSRAAVSRLKATTGDTAPDAAAAPASPATTGFSRRCTYSEAACNSSPTGLPPSPTAPLPSPAVAKTPVSALLVLTLLVAAVVVMAVPPAIAAAVLPATAVDTDMAAAVMSARSLHWYTANTYLSPPDSSAFAVNHGKKTVT